MNRTLKTHKYLGATVETLLETTREHSSLGAPWFHAVVSVRVNFGDTVKLHATNVDTEAEALEWALSIVRDVDFERTN